MLTEIYIEALLVDENLADQVWEVWYMGDADDETACIAWMLIAGVCSSISSLQRFWISESFSGTLDSDNGLSIALFSVEFLILPSNSVAVWRHLCTEPRRSLFFPCNKLGNSA